MKDTYTVKYRQPGQIFWRKIKNVKGDETFPSCRVFHTENDELIFVSIMAEVYFPPERQTIVAKQISKEVGQPVQRN